MNTEFHSEDEAANKRCCGPMPCGSPRVGEDDRIRYCIGADCMAWLPGADRKGEEIAAGRQILSDIAAGRVRSVVDYGLDTLNIISCPSCSRVENEAFIQLAADVKQMTAFAKDHALTIAVMGCRVNGPGETDDADLGLWCGPTYVNLKRGGEELGAFSYDEIMGKLKEELEVMIAQRATAQT